MTLAVACAVWSRGTPLNFVSVRRDAAAHEECEHERNYVWYGSKKKVDAADTNTREMPREPARSTIHPTALPYLVLVLYYGFTSIYRRDHRRPTVYTYPLSHSLAPVTYAL